MHATMAKMEKTEGLWPKHPQRPPEPARAPGYAIFPPFFCLEYEQGPWSDSSHGHEIRATISKGLGRKLKKGRLLMSWSKKALN